MGKHDACVCVTTQQARSISLFNAKEEQQNLSTCHTLQARVKWFAFSFAFYIIWTAYASIAFGTPAAFAVRRYAPVVVLAGAMSAALELHSRRAFLRLQAARDKGAPAAELGPSQAVSSSKKQL